MSRRIAHSFLSSNTSPDVKFRISNTSPDVVARQVTTPVSRVAAWPDRLAAWRVRARPPAAGLGEWRADGCSPEEDERQLLMHGPKKLCKCSPEEDEPRVQSVLGLRRLPDEAQLPSVCACRLYWCGAVCGASCWRVSSVCCVCFAHMPRMKPGCRCVRCGTGCRGERRIPSTPLAASAAHTRAAGLRSRIATRLGGGHSRCVTVVMPESVAMAYASPRGRSVHHGKSQPFKLVSPTRHHGKSQPVFG